MDDDPTGSASEPASPAGDVKHRPAAHLVEPTPPAGDAAPTPLPGNAAPAPLPGDVERTPLPERVVPYWQLTSTITWLCVGVIPIGIAIGVSSLPTIARAALVIVPSLFAILDVFVVQPKRRAIWWYAVGDEQIDLQHGWPIVTRTVVPITRVQHVALEQGPLARRFTLAQLYVHTAAGVVKIPALDDAEGHRIRQRIADLARIADDL